MPTPLVDVLIPAYNAAGKLGRAVRALQAQTLSGWRAVIVDDGSTDGTSALVQGLGEARLHLVRSERNLGRGRARALGLTQCNAPYLALLDADDWCLPERLEQLVGVLEAEPDLGYAASASVVVNEAGQAAGRRGPTGGERLRAGWEWHADRLFHPTLCLRRSVFSRVAYSSARYSEDYFLLLRLCREFDGVTLGEPLYVYEEGGSQTAGKYTLKSLEVARVLWREPAPLSRRLTAIAGIAAKVAAFNLIALAGQQKRFLQGQTQPLDEATRARVERLRREYGRGVTGTFVLSLDTELAWGNCWNGQVQRYARHYNAYRQCVQSLVALLDKYDIPATWAFVGHLLLDQCDGQHADVLRPQYTWFDGEWLNWDPGSTLQAAPWWYGRDLLDNVRGAQVAHEIATHTFSHIIVDDPGCSAAVFSSEIAKCVQLQASAGLPPLRSIVYPNNAIAHLDVLPQHGITAFRGREAGWHFRAPPALRRPAALLFRALPFQPPVYNLRQQAGGPLVDIPASMVLLAYDGVRRFLPSAARAWQAERGLRAAVRQGRVFHLYFHPYNLASSPRMLRVLETILQSVSRKRAAGALRVRTMEQLAAEALAGG